MNKFYDVIIAGAGPAGSIAAKYAAQKGISVLLLEKDEKPGTPVRCGEAVNSKKLGEFVNPDDKWIKAIIDKFAIYSPDGSEAILYFDDHGYILDRSIFDYELAVSAVQSGAELISSAYVFDVIKKDSITAGVKVDISGELYDINCSVVIAADGVESRVGRFAGLRTYTDYRDMECCMQVTASGINNIDSTTCYLYFGQEYAPGGYLWIFPKGNSTANIGLGISGAHGKYRSASEYLDNFMNINYPGAKILRKIAGGVPCTTTLKKISAPGIMIAGDAARQVNPLSGGGIISGMTGGRLAGTIASESVLNKDPDHILSYDREWHKALGKKHEIYNKLKTGIYNFNDAQINSIAASFLKLKPEKRTMGRLFITALVNNPSLIPEVAKVFVV